MTESLDGPTCRHGWNLFNPKPCPNCLNEKYEEYLAGYHGRIAPLGRDAWEKDRETTSNLQVCDVYVTGCPTKSDCLLADRCIAKVPGRMISQYENIVNNMINCLVYQDGCPKRALCIIAKECVDHRHTIEVKSNEVDETNPKDLIGLTKIPLRFIPWTSLAFLAHVMALGAKKYGPMNWRKKKVRKLVYCEAALRHLVSSMDGEENDPESGRDHMAHVMACAAIYLDAKATGNLIDDTFTPGVFGKLVSEMIETKEPKL